MTVCVCTTTCTARPTPRAASGFRQRLEKQAARLLGRREAMEQKRRQQLWRIAKAVDDIAKEECEAVAFWERTLDDDTEIDVQFHAPTDAAAKADDYKS